MLGVCLIEVLTEQLNQVCGSYLDAWLAEAEEAASKRQADEVEQRRPGQVASGDCGDKGSERAVHDHSSNTGRLAAAAGEIQQGPSNDPHGHSGDLHIASHVSSAADLEAQGAALAHELCDLLQAVVHYLDMHVGGMDKAEEVTNSCLGPAIRSLLTAVQAGMLAGKCNFSGQTGDDGGRAGEVGKSACGVERVLCVANSTLQRLATWYGTHPYTAANGACDVKEVRSMLATCSGLQDPASM
jgi:hypothetical protein